MDDQSSIEGLKSELNRWKNQLPPVKHSSLRAGETPSVTTWAEEKAGPPSRLAGMLKSILVISLFFFLAMVGVAGWVFFRGENLVRAGNINLEVAGPATAKAGEEVTLHLTLSNQNSVPLEFVDVTVEYPPGTRSAADPSVDLTRERLNLGTIKPGEVRRQSVRAILFGEAQTQTEIKVVTEYRLQDSNAIFDKTTLYPIEISEAPVSLKLELPAEINSGQELNLTLTVAAEAAAPIDRPAILLHYPEGFQFQDASLKPTAGTTLWELPFLKPGAETTLRLTGILTGQDQDERTFRAEIGSGFEEGRGTLRTIYDTEAKTITIARPYVTFGLAVNESLSGDYLATSREDLKLEFRWENNLPEEITDVEIVASLTGLALDRGTVAPVNGFYQAANNTVLWNKTSDRGLAALKPGDTGRTRLSFASQSLVAAGNLLRNPEVTVRATLRGKRVLSGGEGKTQTIEASAERRIKFASVVQLSAKALHHTGPLTNTGSLPPVVGEETSYTVVWAVMNSSNDLRETRVQASLPLNLKWRGAVTPPSETVEFVPAAGGGGEVIWNLGTVAAGTGVTLPAREVAFQVVLTPSLSQVGEAPMLVSASQIEAVDSFTGEPVSGSTRRELDTHLLNDPEFEFGEDRVVE